LLTNRKFNNSISTRARPQKRGIRSEEMRKREGMKTLGNLIWLKLSKVLISLTLASLEHNQAKLMIFQSLVQTFSNNKNSMMLILIK